MRTSLTLLPALIALALPVALRAQNLYSQGDPSSREQLVLELVNRARANPRAEGARLGLEGEFAGYAVRPPLALNAALSKASRDHNNDMAAGNFFSHSGSNGSQPGDRAVAAGYPGGANTVGENLSFGYPSPLTAEQALMKDDGVPSLDHRRNFLGIDQFTALYRETGIAFDTDSRAFLGELFATRPVGLITGVAYRDANGDNFYGEGEGIGGVSVSSPQSTFSAVTSASGGYALPMDNVQNVAAGVTVIFRDGNGATYTRRLALTTTTGDGAPDNVKTDLRVGLDTPDSGGSNHPAFFNGEAALANGVYFLQFPSGNPFGYYSFLSDQHYVFHQDLGYEYVFDAADGKGGVYLYDFASKGFFYTAPGFPFPYLYDFSLNTVIYYFPDPSNPGRYNTNGVRYFVRLDTGVIFSK